MDERRRFLLALDDTEASARAVEYAGGMLRGRYDVEIHLLHVIGPYPPELLETGGAPTVEEEDRIEAEQEREQEEWLEHQIRRKAVPLFERTRQDLIEWGVPADSIRDHASESIPEDSIHDRILAAAAECHCATVIVGRGARSWIRELTRDHVTEDLIRHGRGFTVWVVG